MASSGNSAVPQLMRIALTGGIAAGKSTVAQRMIHDGVDVIDYDALVRVLQEPMSPAIMSLVNRFGEKILDDRCGIDRRILGEMVFGPQSDPEALQDLNAIMHPLVYELARQQETKVLALGRNKNVIVHDIPLLGDVIDTIPFSFDHIVNAYAPVDIRIQRLITTRNMTYDQAFERVRAQGSDNMRAAISDITINTHVPLEQMFEAVDQLIYTWLNEME